MSNDIIYKDLGAVFDTYVKLSGTGRKVAEEDLNFASEKAMSMLMRDTLGTRYNYVNETCVYRLHKNTTKGSVNINKLEKDKFCNEDYFADLAACRIGVDEDGRTLPRDDQRVQLEAHVLMVKVAVKAEYEDRSTDKTNPTKAISRWTKADKHLESSEESKCKGVESCWKSTHLKTRPRTA